MATVKVNINADGSGFHSTMAKVESRVAKFSGTLNSSFKGNLAQFFGAAAIGLAVKSMADFASHIMDASDRLGVATDKVQELRAIAKHAGKDLEFFDGVFKNIEKSAAEALGGNSKKSNIFKQLGISEADLKHLNKADLLTKMMKGAGKLDRSVAEQLLAGVSGGKNAGQLLGMREELANPESLDINKVSPEDLAVLDEAGDKWGDIVDTMQTSLIPALIGAVDAILKFGNSLVQGFKVAFAYVEGLIDNIKNVSVSGGVKGMAEGNMSTAQGALSNAFKFVTGKQGLSETFNNVWDSFADGGKQVLTGFFGNDAVKAAEDAATTMGQVVDEEDKARDERSRKRIEEARAKQAALAGNVNRAAAPKGDAKNKELLDKDLKSNNAFVKIGGLMGIDATYRLERLSQETNNLLKMIVRNTTPESGDDSTDSGFTD